jgi:hypothetical protein
MKVVWRLGWMIGLLLLVAGCETVKQNYAAPPGLEASPQPEELTAPPGPLRDAAKKAEAGQSREVIRDLSALQPKTPMEKAWHRLLLGEAYFAIGATEKAVRLLLANYEELRDGRPAPEAERSRVLARSLKKLGIYYRDREQYETAYVLHQLQWLYMRRFGSLGDRFDALISLDVDAALLRNYFASEQWLREGWNVTQAMPEGLDRQRSQIIISNNLALSLSELLRFQEAEAAAHESRRLSQLYDAASGKKEFREVWAVAQTAEVHGSWARFTESKNPAESRPLYQKAQALAIEALALAEKQGMDETAQARLEQRMRRYCGDACRP